MGMGSAEEGFALGTGRGLGVLEGDDPQGSERVLPGGWWGSSGQGEAPDSPAAGHSDTHPAPWHCRPGAGGDQSCLWAPAVPPGTTQGPVHVVSSPAWPLSVHQPSDSYSLFQLVPLPQTEVFLRLGSKCPFAELAPVHPTLRCCAQLFTGP